MANEKPMDAVSVGFVPEAHLWTVGWSPRMALTYIGPPDAVGVHINNHRRVRLYHLGRIAEAAEREEVQHEIALFRAHQKVARKASDTRTSRYSGTAQGLFQAATTRILRGQKPYIRILSLSEPFRAWLRKQKKVNGRATHTATRKAASAAKRKVA